MPAGWELALRLLGACALLALSALFSGMTLGILGLDTTELEVVADSGSPLEKRCAATILPVRRSGNLLLCTLLLGNVAVNSIMSVLMADLTSGVVGIIVSTFLLVIIGEIIPQAVCNRHALLYGARFVPLVQFFIVLLYPICKPIAMCLDCALGEEIGTYYSRAMLHKLLTLHVATNHLERSEAAIMTGALALREKTACTVMTPGGSLFSVREDDRLDYALIAAIYRAGYSRVPVWDNAGSAIVGLLYAKDLMLIEPRTRTPVAAIVRFFGRQHVNVVPADEPLAAVLSLFAASRQHFAVVKQADASGEGDPVYKVAGVVTLEDVTESIIGEALADEYDSFRTAGSAPLSGTNGLAPGERAARADAAVRRLYALTHGGPGSAGSGSAGGDGGSGGAVGDSEAPPQLPPEGGAGGHGINNRLSAAEVDGLAAHLAANVRPFVSAAAGGGGGAMTFATVRRLVQWSAVVDFVAPPHAPPPGLLAPAGSGGGSPVDAFGAPVACALYKRGVPADYALVILEGAVEARAGSDGLRALLGPWDVLAEGALAPAPTAAAPGAPVYAPDFSAAPAPDTPVVRALRIRRIDYMRAQAAATDVGGASSMAWWMQTAEPPADGSGGGGGGGGGGVGGGAGAAFSSTAFRMSEIPRPQSNMRLSLSTVAPLSAAASPASTAVTTTAATAEAASAMPEKAAASAAGTPSPGQTATVGTPKAEPLRVHDHVRSWLAERHTAILPPSPFSASEALIGPYPPEKYSHLHRSAAGGERSPAPAGGLAGASAGSGGGTAGAAASTGVVPSPASFPLRNKTTVDATIVVRAPPQADASHPSVV